MDTLPVAHADLTCDGKRILCGEVGEAGEALGRDLSNAEFVAWIAALKTPVVTWGGSRWAEAAGLPPARLIDLAETFQAANGFRVRPEAFGPPRTSMVETVCEMRARIVRCGRLEWRTRAGQVRGFWVPNFMCPVSELYYMRSPFGK
jgi:hypothetical protein